MTIPIPTHITTANYCNSNFLMWLDYSFWTSWGVAANWPIATHALPCLPRPSLTMKMPSSYSKRRAIMGWPAYMGRSPAYRDESSLRPRRWSWGTNLWWLLTCLKLWKLGAVKPSEETCSTMMQFFFPMRVAVRLTLHCLLADMSNAKDLAAKPVSHKWTLDYLNLCVSGIYMVPFFLSDPSTYIRRWFLLCGCNNTTVGNTKVLGFASALRFHLFDPVASGGPLKHGKMMS